MIRYPAKINYDRRDRCFLVQFPDLPGCVTYGGTLAEAKNNAREALTGYLESIDMRKIAIPEPSSQAGKNVHHISPQKPAGFAIWLKSRRTRMGYTQKDMAKLLNITFQSYQKYENPRKANPTLKTIVKVENVLRENLLDL